MAPGPIHDAARDADVETLRRLLAEDVPPDTVDNIDEDWGRTPLHVLCRNVECATRDLEACIMLLRDAGANLEATDIVGLTPLHYAAISGSVELVSWLVQSGVNLDAASKNGYTTALHVAAGRIFLAEPGRRTPEPDAARCVEVLLAAGASPHVRDWSGYTPFRVALKEGPRRTWPLFLRAGAEIPTDNTDPYIVRVRNAGGFQRYAQAHVVRIASILEMPLLPPELVRKVLEFWLHAGYY